MSQTCDRPTNEVIDRFLSLYDVELPNLKKFLNKEKRKSRNADLEASRSLTLSERRMLMRIKKVLTERLMLLDPELRKPAMIVVEKTIRDNPDKQMYLMPYFMKAALGEKGEKISEETAAAMGLANIFFWTAFIIYDDFWDEDEAADPRLLPVANLFARSYIDFFNSLFPRNDGFHVFFHRLMDQLDGANAWETSRCRAKRIGNIVHIPEVLPQYGNYERKYRPASGHVLGPLGLLILSGSSLCSVESTHLLSYFKHYLIAMQMNDDMHDWEEDLRRGHISTVVDMLFRDLGAGRKVIDLQSDMDEIRKVFWFTTLPKIARKALEHTKKSRAALMAIKSLSDPSPLEYFIRSNEKVAQKALDEQKASVQFLNAYGTSYTR